MKPTNLCSRKKGPLTILQTCNAFLIILGFVRMIGTSVLFGHYHLHLLVFASKCFVFAPLLIGSTGLVSMIHGTLGICCYFPRKHFVAYIVALGLISCADLVSSGIYYFLKKGAYEDFFSSVNAARELESYDLDEGVASRWDGLHRRYECCGAYTTGNGNTDWNRVRYGSVPDSCCIKEYPGCGGDVLATTNDQNLPIDSLIYVQGCLTILQSVLHLEILPILSALSFLTLLSALIQIFLVLFTTCIIRYTKKQSDEDEIITMSEVMDDSSQYPSYVQRGNSFKDSMVSSSYANQDHSIPIRKKSVGCCPCFWKKKFVEYEEEPIQSDSFHNQFRLKELTDWEAIEREEMLMSVLDSVMLSRRNSDGLRKSDRNIFPVRMLPIEKHPSRFEYHFDPQAQEGLKCFDFLYEDKYTNTGHPPINRVVVREGSVQKPARISLHSKEDINSISKKVNFSHDNLLQLSSNHHSSKKRFLSDFALPRYQDKSTSCADEEMIPFPPNKSLRRKRLSLPSNINLKKSKSDIASEYLTMDYEEMIIHQGQSSSKVKGKARKLSETQSNERGRDGASRGLISPSRECSTISRDEIIEEITVEEKDLQMDLSSDKEDKEPSSKTNAPASKPLLENRINRHQRTMSSSGKPSTSKDKDQSSEYVNPEHIRFIKNQRSHSLPRHSNLSIKKDTKTSSPPIQRKISFSISPYEEGKPVHRLYQRKPSKESESPLNHDKMYSIVFDDHKESSKQNEKFKKTHLRSRSVHEAPSSKSNSPLFHRKYSLPSIDCRPTTSKAFQRWASIDSQTMPKLPKSSIKDKKVSTADKSSNTNDVFKSMDSIRKGNNKSTADDPVTLSSSLDNQNSSNPFPTQSRVTQRDGRATPKRKLDIFSGGSIRSRSSTRRNTLKRGSIVRGRSHDTITSLPPPSTVPRKYSLKTSEL